MSRRLPKPNTVKTGTGMADACCICVSETRSSARKRILLSYLLFFLLEQLSRKPNDIVSTDDIIFRYTAAQRYISLVLDYLLIRETLCSQTFAVYPDLYSHMLTKTEFSATLSLFARVEKTRITIFFSGDPRIFGRMHEALDGSRYRWCAEAFARIIQVDPRRGLGRGPGLCYAGQCLIGPDTRENPPRRLPAQRH